MPQPAHGRESCGCCRETNHSPKYDLGSTRIGTLRGFCSKAPGAPERVPKSVSNTWALLSPMVTGWLAAVAGWLLRGVGRWGYCPVPSNVPPRDRRLRSASVVSGSRGYMWSAGAGRGCGLMRVPHCGSSSTGARERAAACLCWPGCVCRAHTYGTGVYDRMDAGEGRGCRNEKMPPVCLRCCFYSSQPDAAQSTPRNADR